MMFLQIIAISLFSILVLVNNFASILIIKHNNKKSLGLQTLFDRLTNKVLATAMLLAYEFSFLVYFQVFPIPLSSMYSKIFFYTQNFLYNHLLIWVISIMAFKYLAIFRPSWVDFESEDTKIARNFQVSNLAILTALYSVDQNFLSNVEETTTYILLSGNTSKSGKKGLTKLTKALLLTLIVVFCYTELKIERKLLNLADGILNLSIDKKVLRISFALGVIIASFTIYAVPKVELSNEIHTLTTGVMLFILHLILPHLLFLWKSNETLKTHVFNSLTRVICCKFQAE